MPVFLHLFPFNPLTDAASAMGSGGASQSLDEALDDGFYPPEADDYFLLSSSDEDGASLT